MIRQLRACMISLPLLLAPVAAFAAQEAPEVLVKSVTEDVLSILRQDKDMQAGDHRKAMALIEEKVSPHFDFPRMTSLAVGKGWREADAGQRESLTREFRTLLVRTYGNALTNYKNQTVNVKPSPGTPREGDTIVRTEITQPGTKPISVDYRMAKSGEAWKVFDVAIDNVSLVTNYRGSFATEMAKGGAEGLIKTLQEKNRNPASQPGKGGST